MVALEGAHGEDFVTAYALAAIPARYALERGRWAEAASLTLQPRELPWHRFPQAKALKVFARGLGAARSGEVGAATRARARLAELQDVLSAAGQPDWAQQAAIQGLVVAGWIAHAEGHPEEALRLLAAAADREDATEKHPVTPGPLAPARELLGELLMDLGRPAEALWAFEATLRVEPNRLRALHGTRSAAWRAGDLEKARVYAALLARLTGQADADRPAGLTAPPIP